MSEQDANEIRAMMRTLAAILLGVMIELDSETEFAYAADERDLAELHKIRDSLDILAQRRKGPKPK